MSNTPRRKGPSQRQSGGSPDRQPPAFWREVAEPKVPDPITPATDPTALLRSLGPAPIPSRGGAPDHYFAAVVERAAALAAALAAAAGILAATDDE
jgi:hypothetical protein